MPKEKESTTEVLNIDEPSKAIKLYKITPAEIAAKLKDYDHLKVIEGDTESYKEVRAALTALVHTRTEVDKRRLKLGENLRKSVANINKAGLMLIEPMGPYEVRFSSELKAEDDRKTAIKKEKAEREEARKEGILNKISAIRNMIIGSSLMGLKDLQELSAKLEDMDVKDGFHEYTDQAEKVLDETYDTIQVAIKLRIKLDKEAEERKAEAEHLEKIRKKQEADQKKIDDEKEKIADEKTKLEAAKKAEEDRKKQEAFEKEATEKAEKDAKDKLEKEAKEKEEKDRLEEVERERKAAMAPDKEKLTKWIQGFNAPGQPLSLKSQVAKEIYLTAWGEIEMIHEAAMEKIQKL